MSNKCNILFFLIFLDKTLIKFGYTITNTLIPIINTDTTLI